MVADQVARPAHLNARDTTLVYASRAPQAEIRGLKERMGWEHIPWYTITDDFDKDFGVDEWRGHNAFIREGDRIFRTYLVNGRGDEAMGTTWSYLGITALGRQEEWEDSPEGYPQTRPTSGGTTTTRTARTDDRPRRRYSGRGTDPDGRRRRLARRARLADTAPASQASSQTSTEPRSGAGERGRQAIDTHATRRCCLRVDGGVLG